MASTCVYCGKAMSSTTAKGMTTYHGTCRLGVIRVEWLTADNFRRVALEAEAAAIKANQQEQSQ